MRALVLLFVPLWLGSAAMASAAVEVPPSVRAAIRAFFDARMVTPDTTIWRFDRVGPSPIGGTVYCGRVNMQNSLQQYLGFREFYAIVLRGRVSEGAIMERARSDPTGNEAFKINALCHG